MDTGNKRRVRFTDCGRWTPIAVCLSWPKPRRALALGGYFGVHRYLSVAAAGSQTLAVAKNLFNTTDLSTGHYWTQVKKRSSRENTDRGNMPHVYPYRESHSQDGQVACVHLRPGFAEQVGYYLCPSVSTSVGVCVRVRRCRTVRVLTGQVSDGPVQWLSAGRARVSRETPVKQRRRDDSILRHLWDGRNETLAERSLRDPSD